jgi:predicted PurR-regulated permease PerM
LKLDYGSLIQTGAAFASTRATAVARNVAGFLVSFVIMLFTLFFLFRDGRRMHHMLRDLIPMDPRDQDAIVDRLYDTLTAVMRGMLGTAIAQGILTWVMLLALGVPYSAFLGVLAGFLSFIPLVGPAGVWVPCTIYLYASGAAGSALILLLYGGLVISMADNVLRPLLIGGQAQIPTIFLFFGILGGLQAFGFLGIFLGPVLLAIVVAFLKIYQDRYGTGAPKRAPL